MKYIEVNITLGQNDPFRDLLVDALGNEGPYDSFVETPTGLKAYVQESLFDEDWLKEQLADIEEMTSCSYTFENLPDKNWNEEWEKQHKPVLVEAANGKRVWVRAPFHEHRSDVDYEIEIEPKMSFGTAHHQTTYMMLSYLTELELAGQRVLDMGCGTAVLAILAKIRGAEYVEAIDIDECTTQRGSAECANRRRELAYRPTIRPHHRQHQPQYPIKRHGSLREGTGPRGNFAPERFL